MYTHTHFYIYILVYIERERGMCNVKNSIIKFLIQNVLIHLYDIIDVVRFFKNHNTKVDLILITN